MVCKELHCLSLHVHASVVNICYGNNIFIKFLHFNNHIYRVIITISLKQYYFKYNSLKSAYGT